jgi:hypothetical protein
MRVACSLTPSGARALGGASHAPDTVVKVTEHGYMIHDRVLRPVRVKAKIGGADMQVDGSGL